MYIKRLYLTVEIIQLLHKHACTYAESEDILSIVQDELKQQREQYEYDTVDDFINGYKNRNADDVIIKPLNHVEGFC